MDRKVETAESIIKEEMEAIRRLGKKALYSILISCTIEWVFLSAAENQREEEVPAWKKVFSFLCGAGSDNQEPPEDPDRHKTPEEKARDAAAFLDEEPKWRR